MFFKKKAILFLDIDGALNSLGKIDNPIIDDEYLGLCEYHVNGDTGLTEKDREYIWNWYED